MSDFDPNWPHGHVTRRGDPARIVARDCRNEIYPIVALVALADFEGTEEPRQFTPEGLASSDSDGNDVDDLINAPEPKRVVYVNLYDEHRTLGGFHTTRASADDGVDNSRQRIGCNRIELEPGRWDE